MGLKEHPVELPDGISLETAYDGFSKRRPRRALKPLERDILCRILDDIFHELRETQNLTSLVFKSEMHGIRMYPEEVPILVNIRNVISPRPEGE